MRVSSILSVCGALGALLGAAPAQAFHHHGQFQGNADGRDQVPGSGQLYYTGSRRDLGLRCSSCHVDAPGRIRAGVDFSPALGAADQYAPGTSYSVTVTMTGETRGLSGCRVEPSGPLPNRNGFTAMLTDGSGQPVGTLASESGARDCGNRVVNTTETSVVFGDCEAAVGAQSGARSLTSWTFRWTAPPPGTGSLDLWLGVVDGDCAFDSYDDDVFELTMPLAEGSAALPPTLRSPTRGALAARRLCTPAVPPRRRRFIRSDRRAAA